MSNEITGSLIQKSLSAQLLFVKKKNTLLFQEAFWLLLVVFALKEHARYVLLG